jgi:dihydroorotase
MPRMRALLLVLLFATAAYGQQQYDLLLKGGHVIDPRNRINGVRDVAIKAGKIAEVAANIPSAQAFKMIDVSGLYVTPGLLDMHVHVYASTGARQYAGDKSVYPDGFTFRSGVTTVVDAGTSGWRTFSDFKDRVIDRSRTRVLAMLNIVGGGMAGATDVEQNLEDMDPQAAADLAGKNKDLIVGIKTAHYAGPEWKAVERAVEAGTLANIPVMVDFGEFRPERPFQELVLKKLRPGDIYTHSYIGAVPMLDAQGRVLPYLFEARKRGVLFDVGHGGGSFLFRQAVPAVRHGFLPDSISTDLHVNSMNSGMKDLLNLMSKFLAMDVPLDDVIARATWNPARQIKREELGHLSVGAVADIAVLRVAKGDFGFVDVYGARLPGKEKLVCEVTVRNGLVVYDLNGITRDNWEKLGRYFAQGDERWDGMIPPDLRSEK